MLKIQQKQSNYEWERNGRRNGTEEVMAKSTKKCRRHEKNLQNKKEDISRIRL